MKDRWVDEVLDLLNSCQVLRDSLDEGEKEAWWWW